MIEVKENCEMIIFYPTLVEGSKPLCGFGGGLNVDKLSEDNEETTPHQNSHRVLTLPQGESNIRLQKNAKVFLYLLDIKQPLEINIEQKENSYLEVFFINSGQEIKINTDLQGENCLTNVAGVYNLKEKQQSLIDININHNKPNSKSKINIRGIATDESKVNITMKSYVAEHAIKTNANQLHRAIVLSDDAKVIAKPELEIYNDDVKCSHGNTIGNLDKQALFYLQSRGINEIESREMLINGFLDEAVKFVTNNKVKEEIFNIIKGE